jgi:RNA polymerase sigma factor (sigma-70 family)
MTLIEIWRDGREAAGDDWAAKRRRRQGEHALAQLLTENSPLVWRIVRQRRWGRAREEELHAAGMTGLLRGIERYDASFGCTLSTYAAWWIRQAITREAEREWRNEAKIGAHIDLVDTQERYIFIAGDDVAKTHENEDGHRALLQTIATLEAEEQAVVRTWLATGENTNETARQLNLAEGRTRTVLHAALSKTQHPSNRESEVAAEWEAACRGTAREAYFPGPGRGVRTVLCAQCRAKAQCLAFALERPKIVGIWGGVGEGERKKLRRKDTTRTV